MRFLVDAQLPPALARWQAGQGDTAEHVADLGLAEASDSVVWQTADESGAVIVTKDEDFAVRRVLRGSGPVIVWVRVGNSTRQALLGTFDVVWPRLVAELQAGEPLIEVA